MLHLLSNACRRESTELNRSSIGDRMELWTDPITRWTFFVGTCSEARWTFFFNARKLKPYWFLYEPKPKKKSLSLFLPCTQTEALFVSLWTKTRKKICPCFFHAHKPSRYLFLCEQKPEKNLSLFLPRTQTEKVCHSMKTEAKSKTRLCVSQKLRTSKRGKKKKQGSLGFFFSFFVMITC